MTAPTGGGGTGGTVMPAELGAGADDGGGAAIGGGIDGEPAAAP